MATPVQNATAVIAALIDPTVPSNAQLLKVVDAFVHEMDDTTIFNLYGTTRDLLTNTQKAQIMLAEVNRWVRVKTRDYAIYLKQIELQSQVDAAGSSGSVI